jgi:hypothetical protein
VDERCVVRDDDAVIEVPGVARYRVTAGTDITVEQLDSAPSAAVEAHLLGVALGVAWLQRGRLVLHASAIAVGGRAVAFVGPAGVGKSTVAGILSRRYPLITDDTCVVDIKSHGCAVTWRGTTQLKLTSEASAAIGLHRGRPVPRRAGVPKHYVVPGALCSNLPIPLDRIYELGIPQGDEATTIDHLAGMTALSALATNLHGRSFLAHLDRVGHYFDRCLELLDCVGVYAAPMRRGWDVSAQELARIEEHMLEDHYRFSRGFA